MKKIASVAAVFVLAVMAGCGNSTNDNTDTTVPTSTPSATSAADNANNAGNTNNTTDAVTSASVVDNEEAFKQAISKDGTWIAATLKDLTFTEELVLEGEFTNRDEPARKIALYTQDADHNITNSFTLTAPKLTIKSPNARIQGGTFVGDVYVEADGFSLVNATVEGNVYFSDAKYQNTFDSSDQGAVTGVTEVKE